MKPTCQRSPLRVTTLAKCLLAAWLLASLLFAHGCHGNEDNELFTACVVWLE